MHCTAKGRLYRAAFTACCKFRNSLAHVSNLVQALAQEQTVLGHGNEGAKYVACAKLRLLWRAAPRLAAAIFESDAFEEMYWRLTLLKVR